MAFVPDAPSSGRFVPDTTLDPSDDAAQQLAQRDAVGVRNQAKADRERLVQENVRPGIPLDVDASLPASTRARLSFEGDPDKQVELLSKQPGILAARRTKDNSNILATVAGDDGKQKDVLLNPKNPRLTFSDVAGAASPIAKAGSTAALAAATSGMSLIPAAATLFAGTAGTDIALQGGSRLLAGQDLDPKQLAESGAKEGAVNAALPLAAGALKEGASGVAGLFRKGAGDLERNVIEAGARQNLPVAASMGTGSPALAKAEQTAGLKPQLAEEQTALAAAKARATGVVGPNGSNPVPTEAEIANKAQPIFAKAADDAAKNVQTGFTDAEKAANAQIQARLDSGLVPTNLSQTDAGKFLRSKIEAARDAFQAASQKNYGTLYSLADKEGLTIPTDSLTKLVGDIKAKDPQGAIQQIVPEVNRIFGLESALTSPTKEAVAAQPSGLLDRFGRPVMSPATPEVLPKVTLPQAIELRAVINDKIARGEAVGDIPGRYLKDLAHSLTEAIDTGVKGGSPDLQAAFAKAKGDYAKDIGKFATSDVGRIFKDPTSGAAVGDDEIVPALFRGKGNLDAITKLRDVLGAGSQDYKLLLRQGLQSIVEDARGAGKMIDAGKFLNRINALSPDLRKEALGGSVDALVADSTLLARAQGAKIPADELADALAASPGRAGQLLDNAIKREVAYDQAYNSGIQKQLRDGVLGPRSLGANPDDFVTRFIANGSTQDVRQALTQIGAKSPETVQAIRQRAMANILDETGAKAAVGTLTTGESQGLDAAKLLKFTQGPEREKYSAVLGKDGIQFLDDMATYAEAQAKRAAAQDGAAIPFTHGAAKESAGAIGKSVRDIAGTAYNVAALVPRAVLGNLQRFEPVRKYFITGELPSFGINKTARAAILAAPAAERARESVLTGKEE